MASTVRKHLAWRDATVVATRSESSTARTLILDVPEWDDHVGGQHIDLRLTAEDGYQANRSYSISSGPGERPEITVEKVDDGEVSPFIVEDVEVGDTLEVRGPIGGYFVWEATNNNPLLLIGGGSGIAPLRSIWRAAAGTVPVTILYSARTRDRVVFVDELANTADLNARVHLTREDVDGYVHGRIDGTAIAEALRDSTPMVYVCGPTAFVEVVVAELAAAGLDPTTIRTERFG